MTHDERRHDQAPVRLPLWVKVFAGVNSTILAGIALGGGSLFLQREREFSVMQQQVAGLIDGSKIVPAQKTLEKFDRLEGMIHSLADLLDETRDNQLELQRDVVTLRETVAEIKGRTQPARKSEGSRAPPPERAPLPAYEAAPPRIEPGGIGG